MSSISTIGVVGAGQMGSGIAQVSSMSGFNTYLWDERPEAVKGALKSIDGHLTRMVEKNKISSNECESWLAALNGSDSLESFEGCDLVIEAVTEKREVKLELFSKLDSLMKSGALLASNTSSISITLLAGCTSRPERVMGMHFMNPVPLMKLVELIPGLQTSNETISIIKDVVKAMGKTAVMSVDNPGFTVNRILAPMINEAVYLLQEGTGREDIDQAMVLGTNHPMGPLALADLVGLDTVLNIMRVLHSELGEDKYRPCPLLVKYVEAGWFGRKSGRGFYEY